MYQAAYIIQELWEKDLRYECLHFRVLGYRTAEDYRPRRLSGVLRLAALTADLVTRQESFL